LRRSLKRERSVVEETPQKGSLKTRGCQLRAAAKGTNREAVAERDARPKKGERRIERRRGDQGRGEGSEEPPGIVGRGHPRRGQAEEQRDLALPWDPPRGLTRGRGRVRSERSQKERSVNRGGRIYKPTVQTGAVRGEESKGILGDAPQEASSSCCESSKCPSTTSSGGRRTQRGGVSPSRGKIQERGDSRVGAAPHWRPARG